MTDKEFKRLNRPQLIEIIYRLQLKLEELTEENERLSKELADKRLRIDNAGNIAQAALEIHHVMQAAQEAADHYLEEMKLRADEEYQRILKEADSKATQIQEKAHRKASGKRGRSAKRKVNIHEMEEKGNRLSADQKAGRNGEKAVSPQKSV